MKKILIIDDDQDICLILSRFLEKKGYQTATKHNGSDAIELLKKEQFDAILCDYKLPELNGFEVLQRINILNPEAAVIIITGYSDVKVAVKILKHGASDYVTKPLYPDEILLTIENALEKKAEKLAAASTGTNSSKAKTTPKSTPSSPNTISFGESPQSQTAEKHIDLIAPTDMSVIITGETGTGKEYVAKAIHQRSKRKDKPFVAIDCGALPKDLAGSELFGHVKGAFTGALTDKKGSFELANGGTIFLDEIGNLSYENQIKLLRVLQERKIKKVGGVTEINVDLRIIVATNENLKHAVKEGIFREDIYHRLNEFSIELSPLRERQEDIMHFAYKFLERANDQLQKNVTGFEEEVIEKMQGYVWHGNLRELQNVVKRAVLLTQGDKIDLKSLPTEIIHPQEEISETIMVGHTNNGNLKDASQHAEKSAIINTLKQAGYNKTKAAKLLNIDRKTLYNKLKAYEINI